MSNKLSIWLGIFNRISIDAICTTISNEKIHKKPKKNLLSAGIKSHFVLVTYEFEMKAKVKCDQKKVKKKQNKTINH